ncbi:hypothetical protein [Helicobacter sp.]|uniref:hypothetical protein n=1 Tax=Helicobacter sp. TaxID=218 RepID=UPI0025C0DEED|nr:hypothetical protein [Helicobacter sp.]
MHPFTRHKHIVESQKKWQLVLKKRVFHNIPTREILAYMRDLAQGMGAARDEAYIAQFAHTCKSIILI